MFPNLKLFVEMYHEFYIIYVRVYFLIKEKQNTLEIETNTVF